jgi:hypothetical protein
MSFDLPQSVGNTNLPQGFLGEVRA